MSPLDIILHLDGELDKAKENDQHNFNSINDYMKRIHEVQQEKVAADKARIELETQVE